MKKLLTFTLAFLLAGCGALSPVQPTVAPTTTPIVEIATVLVTVIPTQVPTQVPTSTSVPSPTLAPAATPTTAAAATATLAAAAPSTGETPTLPANAGGDLFTNLTRSGNTMYLRCLPKDITFGVSTANVSVFEVDFFYRIQDRLSTSISVWKNGGAMKSDKNGNFTIDFQSETVSADLRSHKAWLDYEFVGINKIGDAVGRSLKIPMQITYKIECTD